MVTSNEPPGDLSTAMQRRSWTESSSPNTLSKVEEGQLSRGGGGCAPNPVVIDSEDDFPGPESYTDRHVKETELLKEVIHRTSRCAKEHSVVWGRMCHSTCGMQTPILCLVFRVALQCSFLCFNFTCTRELACVSDRDVAMGCPARTYTPILFARVTANLLISARLHWKPPRQSNHLTCMRCPPGMCLHNVLGNSATTRHSHELRYIRITVRYIPVVVRNFALQSVAFPRYIPG